MLSTSATLLWTVMAAPVGPAALCAHLQTHGVSEHNALTGHTFLPIPCTPPAPSRIGQHSVVCRNRDIVARPHHI